ncbi:hypothetical protein [Virgibacillus litoralis]|uniref:Uncharacterized protein n=1 Tax=Virgibacillus litoralis TaxID=578221 RepID=A0ABS4H9G1_9BACI|nr:hypothetical protein [Virgibacillus litoralis]MBP1947535.1 hypothetical protein [Virgibacillus litoralis]
MTKGSGNILKNKKLFYLALFLFLVYIIMSIPFLYESYPEANLFLWGIPMTSWNVINYVGIIALTLLVVSLYLISKSLNKYQGRILLIAILLSAIFPQFLANTYQKTIASGGYAISYEQELSECEITKTNNRTLLGECEIILMNHSNGEVELSMEFIDKYNKDEHSLIEIVNNDAPYELILQGNERKRLEIRTNVNISKLENPVNGGSMTSMNIIIKSDGVERKL